jgi:hypothetical protein
MWITSCDHVGSFSLTTYSETIYGALAFSLCTVRLGLCLAHFPQFAEIVLFLCRVFAIKDEYQLRDDHRSIAAWALIELAIVFVVQVTHGHSARSAGGVIPWHGVSSWWVRMG